MPAPAGATERDVLNAGADVLSALERMKVPPQLQQDWRRAVDQYSQDGLRAARRGDAAGASASIERLARLVKEIEQTWRR